MTLSTPTADGGHVETYLDSSSGNVLHAQKFDAAGQKVGAELLFGSRVSGPYDVVGLAGGGYAIVYQSASPGGSWGEIRIQDAGGATIAQSSTAAGQDFHLVAGDNGGFLVSYVGIPADHGLGVTQPLVTLYDATGHALNYGHIELAGQIASIVPQAGGVMAVNWNDGGVIRTLTLDPHTAGSLSIPATPGVTVLDDVGAVTGAVANGATTDDATPTFRIAVSQVGEVFVELDKDSGGGATYHNTGGGIAITAADVSRGYIDITLPTSGDGHYDAWARVTDASGSASYPVALNFTLQAPSAPPPSPPPPVTSSGEVMTAHAADATLVGGPGDDTVVGSDGSTYLRGGDGNDSILGGAGFNDINGNKGDDTISGRSDVGDWLVGGQGNDLIGAHGGGNIVYGNLGNDTLHGGTGGDILRGGQGDDSIVGGSGAEWISGDRGNDTIQGGSGADTFHTFSGAGTDRVLGFDAGQGDHVLVDPGTTYRVAQVGDDTVIDMGNGDQMILVGVHADTLPSGWIV